MRDVPTLARKLAPWMLLVLFEAGSQLMMKLGSADLPALSAGSAWFLEAASRPLLWLGAACYIGTFAVWMLILARMPLGVAFPASAVVLIVVVLSSWLLLGEQIALLQLVGVALILGGVLLL